MALQKAAKSHDWLTPDYIYTKTKALGLGEVPEGIKKRTRRTAEMHCSFYFNNIMTTTFDPIVRISVSIEHFTV